MSQKRLEVKVGAFIIFCMALLAALLLQFSKGVTIFHPAYTVILDSANVGGLRARASVLMSGVQVGTVSQTQLSPGGTNVSIYLKIFKQYVVRDDAVFKIEQSGFLGDQFVAIYPGNNLGAPLANNAHARAQEPFNLQEAARAASGFIERLDATAKKLDDAINDVRRDVLNEKVLTNLANTILDLRNASGDAVVAVNNINELVRSNGAPATSAVSNLLAFSDRLNGIADRAQGLLATNSPQITSAISNLQTSTVQITNILGQIQAGKGTAGALVNNQAMADDFASLARNLAITTSNLNRLGFWHFIWYKPGPVETNWPVDPTASRGATPQK
jgi:phospholipid/cholesterol/gamma-HCH transport system substrate-binding protein